MKLFLTYLFLLTTLFSQEYHVNKDFDNMIKFISDAPVEDFEGITNNVDGFLYLEKETIVSSKLYFEVDLRTIDTGIGLRNRHMRDNYLETDKFPYASYNGTIISKEVIKDQSFKVITEGDFNVHGISKSLNIEGILNINADEITIEADFIVKLSDHDIEIPQLMFLKINENMSIEIKIDLQKIN